jgi:hypothetical protein
VPEPKNTKIAFKTKISTGNAVWWKMKKWGYVILVGIGGIHSSITTVQWLPKLSKLNVLINY